MCSVACVVSVLRQRREELLMCGHLQHPGNHQILVPRQEGAARLDDTTPKVGIIAAVVLGRVSIDGATTAE